jgi:hypothetical protein
LESNLNKNGIEDENNIFGGQHNKNNAIKKIRAIGWLHLKAIANNTDDGRKKLVLTANDRVWKLCLNDWHTHE